MISREKKYEAPELSILILSESDIIRTSGFEEDKDEGQGEWDGTGG